MILLLHATAGIAVGAVLQDAPLRAHCQRNHIAFFYGQQYYYIEIEVNYYIERK